MNYHITLSSFFVQRAPVSPVNRAGWGFLMRMSAKPSPFAWSTLVVRVPSECVSAFHAMKQLEEPVPHTLILYPLSVSTSSLLERKRRCLVISRWITILSSHLHKARVSLMELLGLRYSASIILKEVDLGVKNPDGMSMVSGPFVVTFYSKRLQSHSENPQPTTKGPSFSSGLHPS